MILPYNRVVRDLNGMSTEQFFEAIKRKIRTGRNRERTLCSGSKRNLRHVS